MRTYDPERRRVVIEPCLEEYLERWRYGGVVHEDDGTHIVEYAVALKKSEPAERVREMLRTNGAPHVIGAELN